MAKDRKALRNTYLWGPVIQGMFLITVSQSGLSEAQTYLYLFLLLVAWIFFYKMDNPRETVLDTERYNLGDFLPQLAFGVLVAFTILSPLLLFMHNYSRWPSLNDFLFQALMVGNVETLWMICMVRMLKVNNMGYYLWPIIFGIAHPVVRLNWFAGKFPLESFAGFVYASLMGILFLFEFEGGKMLGAKWRRLFGPVTPWVTHVTINMIVMMFLIVILDLRLTPI